MVLDIQPSALKFPFEVRKQIRCDLFLRNDGSSTVAFKVKTTAPKKYCVRPNIGVVAPGASVEVQVIMQSQKETPADYAACKDKFLVQAVDVNTGMTADELNDKQQATFAKAEGKVVAESKLRVVYEAPAAGPTTVDENAPLLSSPAKGAAASIGDDDASPPLAPLAAFAPRATDSSAELTAAELDALAAALSASEARTSQAEERCAEADAQCARLSGEVSALKLVECDTLAKLESALKALTAQANLIGANQAEVSRLQWQMSEYKDAALRGGDTVEELQATIAERDATIAEQQAIIAGLRATNADLSAYCADLRRLCDDEDDDDYDDSSIDYSSTDDD